MIWTKMRILNFLLLLICANQVVSEIIDVKPCGGNENCTIHKVQVTPCPEAVKKEPCKLRSGTPTTLEMDFTTVSNVKDLVAGVYWIDNGLSVPWPGFDTNGCKYTTCPTTGKQQTYKYTVHVLPEYTYRTYTLKWRLYKTNAMDCCFITKIKIVAP